jgi:MoxR-like ATPase
VLPEAQLDRFLMRIRLGYPDAADERLIASRHDTAREPLDDLKPTVGRDRLSSVTDEVRSVHLSEEVEGYLVSLVRATRGHSAIRLGGSPRASVALHRASQASAWLSGRAFVRPDDVRDVFVPVMAHRLVLDVEAQMRGIDADELLEELLRDTPVPPLPTP